MKPLAPNTMIQNRYLVVHLIGKGGMGEVYLAVDQRLGSAIALKRTFFADDEMLGNAFEREAKILARLRHPVLPKVSDHFADNGDQYLVMEHISGDDLSKRLESANKPFPVSWVMFWADQLLDALSYLHSHEPPIIHRDIKPQNLKLTDENHIVLLDFGLSKDSSDKTVGSKPGSSGSVVGYTPHFASMEQIRGTGTNARSDIYSLSATLYQLMTNTVPLDALTRADSMLNDKSDPIIALSEINQEISPAVSNVILKGLEVSMDKRFLTAGEMQKALRTAHSQMQNQMSAETQVFSVGDLHATAAPIKDPAMPVAPSEAATRTPTIQPEPIIEAEVVPNLDATLQMDAVEAKSAFRQADVKTEVFLAGDIQPEAPPVQTKAEVVPSVPPSPFDATMVSADPILPVQAEPVAPEFFTTPAVKIEAETPSEPKAPILPPSVKTPVKAKSKSGSKAFVILGGLAALFILALAVLGGAWFYYTNYYTAGNATPTPLPSPSPSVAPTASPEPTVANNTNQDSSSNSDVNSSSNSNSSNQNTATVEPTPSSSPVGGTRTTPVPVTKDPSQKQMKPPITKTTPKPKPRDDRTILLQ